MNNYCDITSIVNKLNKLFDDFNIHIHEDTKKCCDCGNIKPNVYFTGIKNSTNTNRCVDCTDMYNAKMQLFANLQKSITNWEIIYKNNKLSEIKSRVYDCVKCRFNNTKPKERFTIAKDEYETSCGKEKAINCTRIIEYGFHKFSKLPSSTSEHSRVSKIIHSVLTEDVIKLKSILIKLNRKIKNYETSKH